MGNDRNRLKKQVISSLRRTLNGYNCTVNEFNHSVVITSELP